MPAIEMNPPSGIALKPYSVSPRRRDHSVGPKPIMYCPTRTPNAFAGSRWPSSCSAIDRASPAASTRTPMMKARAVTSDHATVSGFEFAP